MTSFVSRLFNGKGKEKSGHNTSGKGEKLLEASTLSQELGPTSHDEVKRRKRKSPFFASLTSRARPLSCIVTQPESPVASRKLLDNGGGKDSSKTKNSQGNKNGSTQRPVSCIIESVERHESAKENAPRSSKAGKTQRPVSCIVDSGELQNYAREKTSPKLKDCSKENTPLSSKPTNQQRSPRPVSCIIENGEGNYPTTERTPRSSRPAKTPRPVSCIVECPCDMTPLHQQTHTRSNRNQPHYKSTPKSTPRYVKNQRRPMSCSVDNLQQNAQWFDRISVPRTQGFLDFPQETLSDYMSASLNLSHDYSQCHFTKAPPVYLDHASQAPPAHVRHDHVDPQESSAYVDMQAVQHSGFCQSDVLSHDSPRSCVNFTHFPPDTPEDGRDIDCSLQRAPTPKPRQSISGGNNYDLKAFFPPVRPTPRPRSLCFPPLAEDGSVRSPPPYTPRPQSVCLPSHDESTPVQDQSQTGETGFAEEQISAYSEEEESGYASPYNGPVQRPRSVLDLRSSWERSSAGPEMFGSVSPRTRVRSPSPMPTMMSSSRPLTPSCIQSPITVHSTGECSQLPALCTIPVTACSRGFMSPPPPRFTSNLRTSERRNSISSDIMSSPSPRSRHPKFAAKYRSADCLDEINEGALDHSPPPARPISHFMGPHPTRDGQRSEDLFTSVEMLEKLGQPRSRVRGPRPLSCFVGSAADESGYISSGIPMGWLGGLSASTGDILEALDRDELSCADDELSFEKCSSLKKAWSVSSLLRNDSIQDRSMIVMRKRRQKMKNRRNTNTNGRSSSTETDEGVGDIRTANSQSSLVDEDDVISSERAEGRLFSLAKLEEKIMLKPRSRHPVTRLHSVHMKAWEIRLRRKQMLKKRCGKESNRLETLV